MWTSILAFLGNLLGGPFAKAAVDAYRAKLQAENTAEKTAADLAGRELAVEQRERELDVQLLQAEQGNAFTRMVRPLWAMPFVIYTWKVVVWDKVFGFGTTDALTGFVATLALTIATAYFRRPHYREGCQDSAPMRDDGERIAALEGRRSVICAAKLSDAHHKIDDVCPDDAGTRGLVVIVVLSGVVGFVAGMAHTLLTRFGR